MVCDNLSVICALWSVVCDNWYVICVLWSVVCDNWSVICGLWSLVRDLWCGSHLALVETTVCHPGSSYSQDPHLQENQEQESDVERKQDQEHRGTYLHACAQILDNKGFQYTVRVRPKAC